MIQINDKFKPLFEGKTKYFVVTGGRGAAKSFAISLWASLKTFAPKNKILFTRYTLTSAHLSIIPEFEEKIELINGKPHFAVTKSEIINHRTGSEVIFRGLKTSSGLQTASLKSLQGINIWIVDEAEEIPDFATFEKIALSIRGGAQNPPYIVIILNPTHREHWIYKHFFEEKGVQTGWNGTKGDVTYIHTTYLDNLEFLDEWFIRDMEALKIANPKRYELVAMGGWLEKPEGVVFPNWSIGDFDERLPVIYGMDFGYSFDPTTLVKVAIDTTARKVYFRLMIYEPHLKTPQIVAKFRDFGIWGELIVADSADPRLIDELKDAGFNVQPCEKYTGSVKEGIRQINDYEIVIDKNLSEYFTKELNLYVWSDKKSEIPVDAHNHAIDAARYAFMRFFGKKLTTFV